MSVAIRHDEQRHKFVVDLEGGVAFLRYVRAGNRTLRYTSAFVPPTHRNRGIGARLVRHALEYAREHGLDVVPTCPFVKRVMEQNASFPG